MTRHQLGLVLAFVAVSLFHPLARAVVICLPPPIGEKDSPYHYLVSLADALSYAKSGLDRTTLGSTAFETLLGLMLGKDDYECARSQVAPFAASPNKVIKTSAEGAATVFSRLADLNEKSVAEIKAFIDAADDLKLGSALGRVAELAALYDKNWTFLIVSVYGGFGAAIEIDSATERADRLRLTRAQRDEILKKIQSTFGDEVNRGMRAGQHPLTAAAAWLYKGLGNPRYTLRDSK